MATDLAEFVGASLGFHLVLGITLMQGAMCTAVLSWLILLLQSQGLKKLEMTIGVMLAVVCVMYIAELVFSHPSPTKVIEGMLIPSMPDVNALYLSAGILGATIMPHVIYLHSAMTKNDGEKLTDSERSLAIKASYWDVGIAMCIASFVNLAMLAMAAAVFFGLPNAEANADLTKAYQTLTPLLGESASLVFWLIVDCCWCGLNSRRHTSRTRNDAGLCFIQDTTKSATFCHHAAFICRDLLWFQCH